MNESIDEYEERFLDLILLWSVVRIESIIFAAGAVEVHIIEGSWRFRCFFLCYIRRSHLLRCKPWMR